MSRTRPLASSPSLIRLVQHRQLAALDASSPRTLKRLLGGLFPRAHISHGQSVSSRTPHQTASASPTLNSNTPEWSHPWFDDGNIILVAQATAFRVHKFTLSHSSPVFKENDRDHSPFLEWANKQSQSSRRQREFRFFDLKAEIAKKEDEFARTKAAGGSKYTVGGVKRPDKPQMTMTQSLSTKMNLDDNEQDAGPKSLGTYFHVLKMQNQYRMRQGPHLQSRQLLPSIRTFRGARPGSQDAYSEANNPLASNDASKEVVRLKVRHYQFSADEETRNNKWKNCGQLGWRLRRQDKTGSGVLNRSGGGAMEKRKREIEERRKILDANGERSKVMKPRRPSFELDTSETVTLEVQDASDRLRGEKQAIDASDRPKRKGKQKGTGGYVPKTEADDFLGPVRAGNIGRSLTTSSYPSLTSRNKHEVVIDLQIAPGLIIQPFISLLWRKVLPKAELWITHYVNGIAT
ncbi:hypothetical protein BDR07DRAFT_1493732 [Suillus spraguei]|nr:hypothetical protein BDR07DRAFT_1493732 [Suillus spraguei]